MEARHINFSVGNVGEDDVRLDTDVVDVLFCRGSSIGNKCEIVYNPELSKPCIVVHPFAVIEENVLFDFTWEARDARGQLQPRLEEKGGSSQIVIGPFARIGRNSVVYVGSSLGYGCVVSPDSRVMSAQPPTVFLGGNPAALHPSGTMPNRSAANVVMKNFNETFGSASGVSFADQLLAARMFYAGHYLKCAQIAHSPKDPLTLEMIFQARSEFPSDINRHLSWLSMRASECESVLELGVRGGEAMTAFLHGLSPGKKYVGVDVDPVEDCDCVSIPLELARRNKTISTELVVESDLTWEPKQDFDLMFIDTFHVYGQLKAELAKFAPRCRKYLIMHDTESDGKHGEYIRGKNSPCAWFYGMEKEEIARRTGVPLEELEGGLLRAIDEFMEKHGDEWEVMDKRTYCSGLITLKRRDPPPSRVSLSLCE